MIDHRHFEQPLRPHHRVGIGALAGEEQRAEFRKVVLREQLAVRVLLLDGPEGGRRGEHGRAAVLRDYPPERAGIGRAHRLPLVKNRGAAVEQGTIDDVAVAHHPTDVRGRPEDLAGRNAVEIPHRPFERDQVATVVAHHALGPSGRA